MFGTRSRAPVPAAQLVAQLTAQLAAQAAAPDPREWTDTENALLYYYMHSNYHNMKVLNLKHEDIAGEIQKEVAYLTKWYPTLFFPKPARVYTAKNIAAKMKRMTDNGEQIHLVAPTNPQRRGKEGRNFNGLWYPEGVRPPKACQNKLVKKVAKVGRMVEDVNGNLVDQDELSVNPPAEVEGYESDEQEVASNGGGGHRENSLLLENEASEHEASEHEASEHEGSQHSGSEQVEELGAQDANSSTHSDSNSDDLSPEHSGSEQVEELDE
jgi:hypothetical protein